MVSTLGCHTPAQSPSSLPRGRQNWTSYKVRVAFSKPVLTSRARIDPPGSNQGALTASLQCMRTRSAYGHYAHHRCVLPSCVFVDPDPHNTTLNIIPSMEAVLTLPAQWAGSQTRTELLTTSFVSNWNRVYFCQLLFTFVSWIFDATEIRFKHQFLHRTAGLSYLQKRTFETWDFGYCRRLDKSGDPRIFRNGTLHFSISRTRKVHASPRHLCLISCSNRAQTSKASWWFRFSLL